jgi:creatinine amidohydrolase
MTARRAVLVLIVCGACAASAAAQIVRVAELNTTQIRALDRSKTVAILPGGMLGEHGPYLPAYTDGILSERPTQELAQDVISRKPGWTALVVPQIPFGSSGSNELGGHFVFPGTYVVRPTTLRAVFMDLAAELNGSRRPRRTTSSLVPGNATGSAGNDARL